MKCIRPQSEKSLFFELHKRPNEWSQKLSLSSFAIGLDLCTKINEIGRDRLKSNCKIVNIRLKLVSLGKGAIGPQPEKVPSLKNSYTECTYTRYKLWNYSQAGPSVLITDLWKHIRRPNKLHVAHLTVSITFRPELSCKEIKSSHEELTVDYVPLT